MRLTCPNCDAEYEVDASLIPDTGRDVQCSSCGHGWFQLPPEVEADQQAEEELYEPPVSPAAAAPETLAPVAPRGLDESVLTVLREEAAWEAAARKADTNPPTMETQTEMGLAPAANQLVTTGNGLAAAAVRRIARLKGIEATSRPNLPVTPRRRKDLLPEIDVINSSLRAASEKRSGALGAVADTMDIARPARSGFGRGFALVLLLAGLLMALYVLAPRLAVQFPAAADALQSYVTVVDAARVRLDAAVKTLIARISGLSGGKG